MNKTTTDKLDTYIGAYTDFNNEIIAKRYKYLSSFFVGKSCLEFGSAEGVGTGYLAEHFEDITAVDGSEVALAEVKKRYPKVRTVHSFFEDLDLGEERFDTVVLAHILEHVDEPSVTIKQAMRYMKPDGVLIVDVPNGNSLHRQIGVKMGLLGNKTDLNAADLSIGHQRVYTPDTFKKELKQAGLHIETFGGMFIKMLSNAQMQEVLTRDQLDAFFDVGIDNPEISAEIFAVAKLP